MGDEEMEKDRDSMELKRKAVSNGCVVEIENGIGVEGNSGGSSGNNFLTYRRRKSAKLSSSSEEKLTGDFNSANHATNKVSGLFTILQNMKEPLDSRFRSTSCNKVSHVRMDSRASTNVSDECSAKDWTKVVLEQMYQSLNETEGGLQDCIRDALVFHQEGSCSRSNKEAVHFGEKMYPGAYNALNGDVGVTTNGSANASTVCSKSDLQKHALFNILTSTKFAELCELLFGNFHGMKANSLFDIGLINSRINEGAYENSPVLFYSDIQQMWTNLRRVGTEMVTLAMSLSETSRAYCHDKFVIRELNGLAKVEQTEGSFRGTVCRHCEEKAEGRDCLVCEKCEDIYHVSCVEPVQDTSLKHWRCAKCMSKGIGLPHEYCVLCQSINAPRSSCTEIDRNEEEVETGESSDILEENGLIKEDASLPHCKICRHDIGIEDFRICGHSFCPSKYYHTRCLNGKQLNLYGSCWYCPSCLCRGCLTDKDDDKIVLCDGCDQAFHIYCMQPPRTSVPKGKWFCINCNDGIQRIRKAKRAYANAQCKMIKKSEREKGAADETSLRTVSKEMDGLDTSGGVDMLLTAAKTLNSEEFHFNES